MAHFWSVHCPRGESDKGHVFGWSGSGSLRQTIPESRHLVTRVVYRCGKSLRLTHRATRKVVEQKGIRGKEQNESTHA